MTVHICTVNYVEHFVNSKEIIFGGALRTKGGDSKYCNFLNSKLRHAYISASFTKFSEPYSRTHFVNEQIRTHVHLDIIFRIWHGFIFKIKTL